MAEIKAKISRLKVFTERWSIEVEINIETMADAIDLSQKTAKDTSGKSRICGSS